MVPLGVAIKRVACVLAAGVTLLVATLLINTWRCRSRQLAVPAVAPAALDETKLFDHLSRALQFQTVSYSEPEPFDPAPFAELHRFLETTFPRVHATLERTTVGGHSLLFHWKGRDARLRPILLMSHMDVVPVEPATEQDWVEPPFSGHVDPEEQGYIWGRGSLDIKSGMMSMLEAAEFLLGQGLQPDRDIYLAFGHDEEVGGAAGNAKMAQLLAKQEVRFEFVLDEGGIIAEGIFSDVSRPVAFVGVAEKGYLTLRISADAERIRRVSGEDLAGHSSMPPRQSVVGIISAAVEQIESNPFPARLVAPTRYLIDYLGPELPLGQRLALSNVWLFRPLIMRQFAAERSTDAAIRTTVAATEMGGGVAPNVLPTRAWALINFRILPGESSETVRQRIRALVSDPRVEISIEGPRTDPSGVSDPSSAAFRTLQTAITGVFSDVLVVPGLSMVTTDSRHYARIADQTFRFLPTRMNRKDLERVHGTNERIAKHNYVEMVQFFIELMGHAGERG